MPESLNNTSKIYTKIRNNASELIKHLSYIKDQVYTFEESNLDYDTQIKKSILGYEALIELTSNEKEFFEFTNKDKEINHLVKQIFVLLTDIVNVNNIQDPVYNIERKTIIELTKKSSLCIQNLLTYFIVIKDEDNINRIESLNISHSLILENGSDLELFEFEFVYNTRSFVLYLIDVLALFCLLKNSNIDIDLLMDIFDIFSQLPSEATLKSLFLV